MLGLLELQRQMCGTVRGQGASEPPGLYRPTHLPPGHPLSVYRNNHRISLAAALAVTFPTVTKLLGADAMQVVAGRFLMLHPPRQPCVAEYGNDFAGYLEGEALAGELPYLPDLARLDWALNRARTAADAMPYSAQDLAAESSDQLGDLQFVPHPSLTLLESKYALPQVYQAIHGSTLATTAREGKPCHLMIWRQLQDARFAAVGANVFASAQAIAAGGRLIDACKILQPSTLPDFMAHFLCSGAFVGNSDQLC
ncbi:MAG: putative DNA-binding domain-containing protein [Proteobacteria bacterium]|nr:putative DNA-binding domain-containing protein [Pseudomonadota bacterium]